MKRIYRKHISPLPMQPHYRQFIIQHGQPVFNGSLTLWQIVNNFEGPIYEDDEHNVYTPGNIFLFPHE